MRDALGVVLGEFYCFHLSKLPPNDHLGHIFDFVQPS